MVVVVAERVAHDRANFDRVDLPTAHGRDVARD